MSTGRDHRLALIIKALDDMEREKQEYNAGWKERHTVLENQLAKLTGEVLSGQLTLVPDEPEPGAITA
jgi:hypothetical protein